MRSLATLALAIVIAFGAPGLGEAQMRAGGFRGGWPYGGFGHFRPRFERPPPYASPPPPGMAAPRHGLLPPPPPPPDHGDITAGPPARAEIEQQDAARQGVREGQMAPLDLVIANIQRRAPGRQLDSVIEYAGPRQVYRVRWLTRGGRRVDYIVDAATGQVLGER